MLDSVPLMIHALVLGVIQGLAEFLPISSSAHLILIPRYLGWNDPGLAFDVALHLGTLAAVVLFFWKDLLRLLEAVLHPQDPSYKVDLHTLGCLAAATIPGAIAGFLLEHRAETVFRSAALIAWALILLGVALGIADQWCAGSKTIGDLSIAAAIGIGLAQSFALIPGVSRSGVTITVALLLGFNRKEAARFSFLLSIPIIAGAGLLKFKQIFLYPDHFALVVGFIAAAISGLLAIWALMRYVQAGRYTPFVLYRWALGAFVLLNLSRFAA